MFWCCFFSVLGPALNVIVFVPQARFSNRSFCLCEFELGAGGQLWCSCRLVEDSDVYKRFKVDGARSLPLDIAKRLSRGNGFILSRCLPHGR
eukprot:3620903-Amphidinium_carterae.1